MLVYGVPVGIPHMYFVIPLHCDVGSGVSMLVLCILLGALCGCFIAVGMAVRAVYYIIGYPLYCMWNK